MHKSLIEWRGTDQHPLHPEKPVLLSEGERNVGKKRNKKWEGEERKRLKRCKAAGNGGEKGAEDRRQEGK